MESIPPISVSPAARVIETVSEHAQSAFKSFEAQFNTSTLPLILQPSIFSSLALPLQLTAPMKYDAIIIELSSPDTEIRIPLTASSNKGSTHATRSCAINIDVAHRDNCLLSSPLSERSTCSKPRILQVEVIAGNSYSAKVPLKSRFNIEFTFDNVSPLPLRRFAQLGSQVLFQLENVAQTSNPPNVGFLPIAWETISLPCPSQQNALKEIRMNISSDESGIRNNTDISSPLLYLGPVRMTST